MDLQTLAAREEIRQLRIDYSTAFDTMDESFVRRIMTDDIRCDYPAAFGGPIHGIEAVLALFRATWAHCRHPLDTLHVITNHSIAMTGPDTAEGHCLLLDVVNRQEDGSPIATPGGHAIPLLLIGRYDDRYVRQDGAWKFARIGLITLWPERAE